MTATLALALLQRVTVQTPSALDPHGPAAARIATLWWFMTIVGALLFLLVAALLLWPLYRRGAGSGDMTPEGPEPPELERKWIIGGGAIMPAVVLTAVFLATLFTMRATRAPAQADALVIDVIGHQWWWEIRYAGLGVVTANELHLPVGRPVRVRLASADVIHSFWVPQLHGKTDLIPGQRNESWLEADEPGVYYGKCAEFCGVQHAHMALTVTAEAPAEFADWAARERQPARPTAGDPGVQLGQRAFLRNDCAYCHSIRGTPARGELGPDLTHFGSRRTIGAGSFDNNVGNLAGWIENPDVLKPGVLMPAVPMTGDELNALVTYLESLK